MSTYGHIGLVKTGRMRVAYGRPDIYESMASPEVPNPAKYFGVGEGVRLRPGGYLHRLSTQRTDFSGPGLKDIEWGRFDAAPTLIKAGSEEKAEHPARTFAKAMAGLGLGTAAGYGGMQAVRHLIGAPPPPALLQWGVPVATGIAGLAYPYFHQRLLEKMREGHSKRQEAKHGRKDS